MASRMTALRVVLTLTVVGVLATPTVLAQAEDYRVYGDEYESGDFGRIQFTDNGVTIRRAAGDPSMPPEEQATVNSPLFPGDTLLTQYDQRAEVQLVGGSVIRIDRRSEATFLAMPARSATYTDNTVLQLAEGRMQITALLDGVEEFRIDTPAATVYLLGDGDFRVEVNGSTTEVFSRRGVAEVVGDGGSVLVRGGTRTDVDRGGRPGDPWSFNTFATDAFDRWVEDRVAAYASYDHDSSGYSSEVYDDLPYEVQPYYRELSSNGRWVYSADYGRVWYPYDVGTDWRPYSDGYWSYGPRGYFWVSYEPWGWAPYHYGRWTWVASHGWCWIPGRIFGGAWVAWSWGSLYVGWSPLDYWNRPCYVHNVYYGYYDYHSWTFVHYNHFNQRNYRRYAVDVREIGDDLRGRAVVTRPPRVSPTRLAKDNSARVAAARRAREDTTARLKPVDTGSRPSSNVNDLERRMTRDALEKPAVTTGAGAPAGRPAAGTRERPSSATNPGSRPVTRSPAKVDPPVVRPRRATPDQGKAGTERRRDPAIRTPSRPSQRPPASGAGSNESGSGRRESAGREPARPQVQPRRDESSRTDTRRRELYEKMAQPRPTRERPTADSRGSRGSSPGASSRSSRPAPPPSRPRAAPQRPSNSPAGRSAGSRSSGSAPRARSGSSSGSRGSSGRRSSGSSRRGSGSKSSGSKSSGGKKK